MGRDVSLSFLRASARSLNMTLLGQDIVFVEKAFPRNHPTAR
jgi:hypothetical protein